MESRPFILKTLAQSTLCDNTVHLHSDNDKNQIVKFSVKERDEEIYYPLAPDKNIPPKQMHVSETVKRVLNYQNDDKLEVEFYDLDLCQKIPARTIELEIREIVGEGEEKFLNEKALKDIFLKVFHEYPLSPGQDLLLPYYGKQPITVIVRILAIQAKEEQDPSSQEPFVFYVQANTQFRMAVSLFCLPPLYLVKSQRAIPFDFAAKGVGGYKKQMERIVRDCLFSRVLPGAYARYAGVKHTKGLLLYGPPGTGKTVIAKALAETITDKDNFIIVNGPQLLDKYVGQSEAKLREIFAPAEQDYQLYGDESPLHVIFLDEIDAIAPERGTHAGTGVDDNMVATLLTKLDGSESTPNVLVIAATNRLNLIDRALLRPGRFELAIEIPLPSEEGRREILAIHTDKMRLLSPSVNLDYWAKMTKNYSGAELMQLVKKAQAFALGSNIIFDTVSNQLMLKESIQQGEDMAKITNEHFIKAYAEILPAFGIDSRLQHFSEKNFALYNKDIEQIANKFVAGITFLEKEKTLKSWCFMLTGETGTGKTSLALFLAKITQASYMRVIGVRDFIAQPIEQQVRSIQQEFERARAIEFSVIVLDDLENLLQVDAGLKNYNNLLRLSIESELKSLAESDNKCIVIATSRSAAFLQEIKLDRLFNETDALQPLCLRYANIDETFKVLGNLCDLYGYHVAGSTRSSSADKRKIQLPIRDLIYQIKRFCEVEDHYQCIDLDEFYRFLNPPSSASQASGWVPTAASSPENSPPSLSLFAHGVLR